MRLLDVTLYPTQDDYLEKVEEVCKVMEEAGKPIVFKGGEWGAEEDGTLEEVKEWLINAKWREEEETRRSRLNHALKIWVVDYNIHFYVRVTFVWEVEIDEYNPFTWPENWDDQE